MEPILVNNCKDCVFITSDKDDSPYCKLDRNNRELITDSTGYYVTDEIPEWCPIKNSIKQTVVIKMNNNSNQLMETENKQQASRKFTDNQLELLLYFFTNINYAGWRNIATSLLETGQSIVPGENCIWVGGIGNFITLHDAPQGVVGCVLYKFNYDEFILSEYYKEQLNHQIQFASAKAHMFEQKAKELSMLLPAITDK